MNIDPLAIKCPYCWMPASEPCSSESGRVVKPHKTRVKLALQMAAHADPALDKWPQLGPVSPCGLCGSGLPQRHRIVDAIACRLAGGEVLEDITADYDMPLAAVRAVMAWALRWPGAWS